MYQMVLVLKILQFKLGESNMEYDSKAIFVISVCIIFGTILLLIGIITSEIEITKNETKEIYDNFNN